MNSDSQLSIYVADIDGWANFCTFAVTLTHIVDRKLGINHHLHE